MRDEQVMRRKWQSRMGWGETSGAPPKSPYRQRLGVIADEERTLERSRLRSASVQSIGGDDDTLVSAPVGVQLSVPDHVNGRQARTDTERGTMGWGRADEAEQARREERAYRAGYEAGAGNVRQAWAEERGWGAEEGEEQDKARVRVE